MSQIHSLLRTGGRCVLAAALFTAAACDGARSCNAITGTEAAGALRTAADSSAALARNLRGPGGALLNLSDAAAGIPIEAGQRAVVTVTGAESSRCENISVTGAINQLVLTEVGGCYGNPSYGIGKTTTLGPAASSGTLTFIVSTGAGGTGLSQVTGTHPDYVVGLDDGLYDADYNDVVISVHIEGGGKLKVECTPVTRGESTTCTASSQEPGAAFTVTEWKFEGDGQVVREASRRTTWEGDMAVSGTVTVTATMAGRPETASTAVQVQPRSWPDQIPGTIEQAMPNCAVFTRECPVVYPPTASGHLGKAVLFWEARGRTRHINRGPNAGWSYVIPRGNAPAVVSFPRRVTFLNPVLSRPNDPWYQGRPGCTQPMLMQWVQAHEGVHQAAFTANADGRINAYLEKITGFMSAQALGARLADEVAENGPVDQLVRTAGDGDHTSPEFGPAPCAWNLADAEP